LAIPPISYMHSLSLSRSWYMPCPSHPPWLEQSNYTWWNVQVMKLLTMSFSPISCLFVPNILLSALFSNTLSQGSSLNVRNQVSHPYRTTGKIIVIPFRPIRDTCPARHILPTLIILIILGEEYKLWSFSLCGFLQPPIMSSLFGPNIVLSTLLSNTLSLFSSLYVRNQVSHPYRTTDRIIILYIF
jgi:hypothetical protein